MRERPTTKFFPGLERLEAKRPLSGGVPLAPLAPAKPGPEVSAHGPADPTGPPSPGGDLVVRQHVPIRHAHHGPAGGGAHPGRPGHGIHATAVKPNFGFLVFRVTNPNPFPATLTPPFGHVLVQGRKPVPGQVYNILQVAVKNETDQTFDASSGFQVRISHQPRYLPILTGDETWKPGQDIIFYVMTKKYYPLTNQVTDGFQFLLGGAWSVAIPGPSGIFLRVKYNPATINRILDHAVTQGPGAQGGAGIPTGITDTAIYAFVSSKENRNDFGGYF